MKDVKLDDSQNPKVGYGERRGKIIDAAILEFSHKGFSGAKMRGIGQRAKVNHQLIVHYFDNMEGLWRATMEQLVDEATGLLESGFAEIDINDPRAVLESAVLAYINFSVARPEMHRIMSIEAETSSARIDWLMDTHLHGLYQQFTTFIKNAQESGAAGPESPGAMFYALIGAVNSRFNFPKQSLLLSGEVSNDAKAIAELHQICRRLVGLI